ncbi:MAG: hypothetical protein FJ225_10205 [Lentisphaerae bacterium]|nr:hypothetical protein [Lentisphaerota bacterium]
MNGRRSRRLILIACAAAAAAAHTACEVDSASGEIIISPSSAALKKGESIQFTASGGFQYRWRLKNEKWGTLSARRGPSTVYTSLFDPRDCLGCDAELEEPQILYADSYIPDGMTQSGAAGGTNSVSAAGGVLGTGEAYITHLSERDAEEEDEGADGAP